MRFVGSHLLRARLTPFALSLFTAYVACGGEPTPPNVPGPTTALPGPVRPLDLDGGDAARPQAPVAKLVAVDDAALDRSVNPCDDFYSFACGGWMKQTPIPEDQATWTRSFSVMQEQNQMMLRDILEAFSALAPAGEAYGKELGDLYGACMDERAIETRGETPLKADLAIVDSAKNPESFAKAVAGLHLAGVGVMFGFDSEQDLKDSTQFIGAVWQGGLGLPERDYYIDPKRKDLLKKYEEHVERMFALAGEGADAAKKDAKTVVQLEKRLAEASMKRVMLRNPENVYHPMDLAKLTASAPGFPWKTYFAEFGLKDLKKLNIAQPDFARAVGRAAQEISGQTGEQWRTYLKWHVLHDNAKYLPARFVDEDMRLNEALTGTAKLLPRWKRCVKVADIAMGEALARPFVRKTLGEEGKADTQKMIRAIEESMGRGLERLPWMDAPTRAKAIEKLHHIANKVGYPDVWRKYDGLVISRNEHLENVARANAFEMRRRLAKIGQPVDRNEWLMTPPTVNAYYDPSMNEMVFPAGILQAPFYSSQFPSSVNFGGIGLVMGHELTHGFDDEGRKFDAKGNVTDWWSPASNAEFKKRAECIEKQYSEYIAVDELKVDGKLTLGENIADFGGMRLALASWRALGGSSAAPDQAAGFGPDQQFFLGFAQGWCSNLRREAARRRATDDFHSPPRWRVNGVVSNSPDFAKAFSCKEGSPMVRGEGKRCDVW